VSFKHLLFFVQLANNDITSRFNGQKDPLEIVKLTKNQMDLGLTYLSLHQGKYQENPAKPAGNHQMFILLMDKILHHQG